MNNFSLLIFFILLLVVIYAHIPSMPKKPRK